MSDESSESLSTSSLGDLLRADVVDADRVVLDVCPGERAVDHVGAEESRYVEGGQALVLDVGGLDLAVADIDGLDLAVDDVGAADGVDGVGGTAQARRTGEGGHTS